MPLLEPYVKLDWVVDENIITAGSSAALEVMIRSDSPDVCEIEAGECVAVLAFEAEGAPVHPSVSLPEGKGSLVSVPSEAPPLRGPGSFSPPPPDIPYTFAPPSPYNTDPAAAPPTSLVV